MPDLRSFHFKTWSEEFEKNLPSGVRRAFDKAEEAFENKVGTKYYSSFESFKSARTKRKKNRK